MGEKWRCGVRSYVGYGVWAERCEVRWLNGRVRGSGVLVKCAVTYYR